MTSSQAGSSHLSHFNRISISMCYLTFYSVHMPTCIWPGSKSLGYSTGVKTRTLILQHPRGFFSINPFPSRQEIFLAMLSSICLPNLREGPLV